MVKSSERQNGRTPVFREREVRRSCGRVPEGCLLGRRRRSCGLSHGLGGERLRRTILFLISRLMRAFHSAHLAATALGVVLLLTAASFWPWPRSDVSVAGRIQKEKAWITEKI